MNQPITSDAARLQTRIDLESSILAKVKRGPRFLLRELFDFLRGRASCHPSNRLIVHRSGMSPRAVRYLLRQLENAGIVKCIRDLSIRSQRRIVLLDHPRAGEVLRRLASRSTAAPPRSKQTTTHWRKIRQEVLDRDKACAICRSTEFLEVHHRTYERIGEERQEDLITLCRECHQIFHQHKRTAEQ